MRTMESTNMYQYVRTETEPIPQPSVVGKIPRFDFAQAKRLADRGVAESSLIAAANRLGDIELAQQIVVYMKEKK